MKKILLLLSFLLFISPSVALAGPLPNWTVRYDANNTAITHNGTHNLPINQSLPAHYAWPASFGIFGWGNIYRGTFQKNAERTARHSLGTSGSVSEVDKFLAEDKYFVVIYSIPSFADTTYLERVSDWFANGTSTNPAAFAPPNWGIIEFTVGNPGVPLYTQIESSFPSRLPQDEWANRDYANGAGVGSCGQSIGSCGCALTSAVMVSRFYGITNTQGQDVNPLTMNEWLEENNGFGSGGGVNWNKIAAFTDYRMKFTTRDETTDNFPLLDSFLNTNRPLIARADPGRGHNSQHFFVIDRKLSSSYRVKDPRWYNTATLSEPLTDHAANVRAYLGGFDALRGFIPHDGTPYASLSIALGSPAELLITDTEGRRLGKDPATGTVYNEIPGASYGSDDIGDPNGITPPKTHAGKVAYFDTVPNGNLDIRVIGTDTGPFTLSTNLIDTSGNSLSQTATGTIHSGISVPYIARVDPNNATELEVILADTIPPQTSVTFLGTQGLNGWYRSNVEVTFNATDSQSNVERTEYSLDGVGWIEYTGPLTFNIEGVRDLWYRSIDEVGNSEDPHTVAIQIDTHAPEVVLTLNPMTRIIEARGRDTLDDIVSISTTTNEFIAQDDAGNTTRVVTKSIKKTGYLTGIRITAIQYNNGSLQPQPDNAIAYGWKIKNGTIDSLLEGTWVRNVLALGGLFTTKSNQTSVTSYDPVTKKTVTTKHPGLVMTGIETRAGTVVPFVEE